MYQKATSQCCTEIVYTYSANSSSFFRLYAQAAVVSAPDGNRAGDVPKRNIACPVILAIPSR